MYAFPSYPTYRRQKYLAFVEASCLIPIVTYSKQRLLERMGRRHHTAFAGRSDYSNSYSNSSTFLPICLAMSGPAVLRICVVVAIPRSVHLTPNSSIKKLQILRPPHGALSCIFSQTRKAFVRMARYLVFLYHAFMDPSSFDSSSLRAFIRWLFFWCTTSLAGWATERLASSLFA